VAWLQNWEAPRFAHLPLFSLSSAYKLLYSSVFGTHTLFVFSLFYTSITLFCSCPHQDLLELAIYTHSHFAGSSVRCFATLKKPLSIGQGRKGRGAIKGSKKGKLWTGPPFSGGSVFAVV
jgi:hypothetical protein